MLTLKWLFSGIDPELIAEEQADSGVDDGSGEDKGSSSRLWVDQFSPQHYTDLLSDDVSHRYAHLKTNYWQAFAL